MAIAETIDVNNTADNYDRSMLIHMLFEKAAAAHPEKTALVCRDERMSYETLNRISNRLAAYLVSRNIRKSIIGLIPARSFEMFAGMLGILKSGNAYLPIDPEYPQKRIEYVLENSRTPLLFTGSGVTDTFDRLRFDGSIIDISAPDLFPDETTNPDRLCDAGDLAYVIYTSGSTGKPKGVMIEHRAVCNFIHAIGKRIPVSGKDKILGLTTIAFDIFVLESLFALACGLTIVIATEKDQKNHKLLSDLITRNKVTIMQITPSHLDLLLSDTNNTGFLEPLKSILVGGEALDRSVLKKLKEHYSGNIFNMYGPTETTVWSMIKDLTDHDRITIGSPVANTQVYIVDENMQPAGTGVPGELCIAGDGLARGYLYQDELTDEKFIAHPFIPGTRMYRTGDLVRQLPDGEMEFLGRIDNQVKIKGHRIEPEEIESAMQKHESVHSAVVVVKQNEKGEKYLAAFYSGNTDVPDISLRNFLKQELTEHMVPSVFVRVDKIPLTPNGKKDRHAAEAFVVPKTADQENVATEDDTGARIMAILSESTETHIPVDSRNAQHDMREIGIDSFAFTKAVISIENEFNIDLGFEEMDMKNFTSVQHFIDHVKNELAAAGKSGSRAAES